ncbi:hypothetical protein AB0M41_44435 [Streptomyces sp. NPDC051896]|uniref:hypothetical protein n=1 Tax=Streptomyces sp. NPDC051896 TaxID=3155416 RepID=UPI00344A3F7E
MTIPAPTMKRPLESSDPDGVSDDDRQQLKEILARCLELEAATGHVRSFAAMMALRSADRLPQWIADARADESHGLRAFADGLMTDLDAVTLGLSTPWSSGCVEGRVTDIKLLKRQMAGGAAHPLLRKHTGGLRCPRSTQSLVTGCR